MQTTIPDPKVFGPKCVLGEAPVWDAVSARLSWVDCDRKQMFRLDPESGDVTAIDLPGHPGSYAFRSDGTVLIAYRTSLALVDLASGSHQAIETPGIDFAKARFNDGACDRAGRFWLGTMHKAMSEPVGALYRVDPDLSVRQMAEGFVVSNGIAFSPDDRVMYQTDSRPAVIYAYEFDLASGAISGRRVFAGFDASKERPDGCTIDKDGCLWVAMLGGGRVAVLDPDGKEMRSISLPTRRPTSLCFGGPSLDTLFVTSMTLALSEEELAAQPDAGRIFAFEGIGRGLAEPNFGVR